MTSAVAVFRLNKLFQELAEQDNFKPDTIDDLFIIRQLALIHSEISEAVEGHRRDRMDSHLPHRKEMDVELADAFLRIVKFAVHMDIPLAEIICEKEAYNRTRHDHSEAARNAPGGKRF